MSIAHDLKTGLREMERALGSPVATIDGSGYACSSGSLRRGTVIIVGGMEVEISNTLFIRTDVMPTAPKAGVSKATVNGTQYRIVAVNKPAPGSHWELDLADLNK